MCLCVVIILGGLNGFFDVMITVITLETETGLDSFIMVQSVHGQVNFEIKKKT